jgi:hypothetical protein
MATLKDINRSYLFLAPALLHHPFHKQQDLPHEHQLQLEVKPVIDMRISDTGCNGYKTYLVCGQGMSV